MNFKSDRPCVACGLSSHNMVCQHHVYGQKAYPEFKNEPRNLMPLCLKHHNEIHSIALRSFAVKYPGAKKWLVENGWVFNEFLGKWVNSFSARES